MAGNLTAGGLGQPGGLLVTGGIGAAEPAAPGSISAHLYGTGTLTGDLTDANARTSTGGAPFFGYWARPAIRPANPIPGHMSAHLYGSGSLTGDLDGVLLIPAWVDQLTDLLMFDLV